MSLEIVYINNEEDAKIKEGILLIAKDDLNLKDFALVDNTFKNSKTSNVLRHFFKFPEYPLNKGQYVLLFTGIGDDHNGVYKDKHFCRKIFWGLKKSILNDDEIESIEVLKVSTIDKKRI